MSNVIFIHGLESSGHGFKGNLFRERIPGCFTPDLKEYSPQIPYQELLKERMTQLNEILETKNEWKIIASSFGGLMAALFTLQHPNKVDLLILLAPLLAVPELNPSKFDKIDIPVIVYHGKNDGVISIKPTKKRANKLFTNLSYNLVDDDHMLHPTVENLNWKELLNMEKG
ncbi:MAG: hypothetical protein GF311_25460 [Candidatus Lokiarchaeota archaeon]|nr:hypothetical protein [Candidatus Lokiarchaeota archaeon]